jgi:hypothetical protein
MSSPSREGNLADHWLKSIQSPTLEAFREILHSQKTALRKQVERFTQIDVQELEFPHLNYSDGND